MSGEDLTRAAVFGFVSAVVYGLTYWVTEAIGGPAVYPDSPVKAGVILGFIAGLGFYAGLGRGR